MRAFSGQCNQLHILHGCKKSCGLCGDTCRDVTGMEGHCAVLKQQNLCLVHKLYTFTLCSKTCGFCAESEENPPEAATKTGGVLKGSTVTLKDGSTKIHEFNNIRYGVAPTGNLRFRPPQRHIVPESTKVEATDKTSIKCVDGNGIGREDCLFLDVKTPDLNGSRPVLVWLHPGALKLKIGTGFNAETTHKLDAVTVNISFRLGFLGFSSVEELWDENEGVYANNGIRDMVAALDWMQDNIAAFGGDPNSVTIVGESGGATAVLALTCSPLANNKFHAGISLSPAPEMRFSHEDGNKFQRGYVQSLGCSQESLADRKQCLLALPANRFISPIFAPQLLPGFAGSAYFGFPQIHGDLGEAFGFVMIDPVVVTVAPRDLKNATFTPEAPLKIILANAAQEITHLINEVLALAEHDVYNVFTANVQSLTRKPEVPGIVERKIYPGKSYREIYSFLLSDMRSTCPTNDVAREMSLSQNHEIYRLYFTHYTAASIPAHGIFGTWLLVDAYDNYVAEQMGAHFKGMVKKLAWKKEVESGWKPFPGTSMTFERSAKISRITEEEPQQGVCEALTELDLVKYGWQN